jgi:D-alanine transaminase|tara:strand:+ start:614 stop:1465 length:852 start_codon:yes stop_codon:yes gene_type:complete
MSWAYLNNAFHRKEEVTISPYDRGFLFGDGVYEVIPSYAGKPFLYEEHVSRLLRSLNEVSINKPEQWENLKSIIEDLLEKNKFSNQIIYIQVTRGQESTRSHAPDKLTSPTLFIESSELTTDLLLTSYKPPYINVGIEEDLRWTRCDIKAITLLGNVMTLDNLSDSGLEEVIFYRDSTITEGAKANIFLVFGKKIVTPPVSNNILSGITRNYFINLLSQNNFNIEEREVSINEIEEADEIWFTSSGKVLQMVHKINNKIILEKGFKNTIGHKAIELFRQDILV